MNDANYDYRVNVLEYWETKQDGRKQYFSWVTKLLLTSDNVYELDSAVFNPLPRSVRAEEAFTPSRSLCTKASRQG
jgi:hypothetical protein